MGLGAVYEPSLTEDQIAQQFGPRNFSRMNGLMAFVSMHGKDVRLGDREVVEVRIAK